MAGVSAWANSGESQSAGGLSRAPVDPWLCQNVLNKQRNIEMLQRLEDELEAFVRDPTVTQLEAVPPGKSEFQRRVVNLVALHYGLLHKIGPKSSLILLKSPDTRIPFYRISSVNVADELPRTQSALQPSTPSPGLDRSGIQLVRRVSRSNSCVEPVGQPADLLEDEVHAKSTAAALAKRPEGAQAITGAQPSSSVPLAAIRSVTEEEYAAARARIFQSENAQIPPVALSENQVSPPLQVVDRKLESTRGAQGFSTGERLAAGPQDGSRGFGRGRGKHMNSASAGGPALGSQGSVVIDPETGRSQDWYDPDFDRSYHRWMAPPNPNFNVAAAAATAAAAAAAAAAMQNHHMMMHSLASRNAEYRHYGFNNGLPNAMDYQNFSGPIGNGMHIPHQQQQLGPGPRVADWTDRRAAPPLRPDQAITRPADQPEDLNGHLRASLDDMSAFPPLSGPSAPGKTQPS